MKIIFLLLAIILSGCSVISVERTDQNGATTIVKYKTLWRNIEDVDTVYGGFEFSLGKSGSEANSETIACLIAPQLCE